MRLLLWLIFRQLHPIFINVRLKNSGTTDKNLLTKSSTKRFREYSILTGSRKTGNLTHTLT
ncbi:hypothetical protein DW068_10255 [Anaerobutyricum hallii]|uniref:Uncharacterized protein n=1 Tax=Anaerobutyricum hallii TaxID=39488 RepID=A0A374NA13_9FIRM|nr:hypothetical protein DXD91_13230 [Anaerobutyricum hallii]RHK38151.1 hypothetical protein DW068_10255 [Anaerobutyricum hallii]